MAKYTRTAELIALHHSGFGHKDVTVEVLWDREHGQGCVYLYRASYLVEGGRLIADGVMFFRGGRVDWVQCLGEPHP